jgi:hypothetical protein
MASMLMWLPHISGYHLDAALITRLIKHQQFFKERKFEDDGNF